MKIYYHGEGRFRRKLVAGEKLSKRPITVGIDPHSIFALIQRMESTFRTSGDGEDDPQKTCVTVRACEQERLVLTRRYARNALI